MRLRPGFRPDTPLAHSAPPGLLAPGFKGAASRRGGEEGRERRGRERWGREREEGTGKEGKERGGEVDSDVQLEEGRRWAKAGPANVHIPSLAPPLTHLRARHHTFDAIAVRASCYL